MLLMYSTVSSETGRQSGRNWLGWLRLVLALAVLVASAWLVDARAIWQRLSGLQVGWLAVAFAISALQLALMAARWCVLSRQSGVPLRFGVALGEYYLAALLNFVSPLGMAGDAVRALRHNQLAPERPPLTKTALAIVLERASGQLALWLMALATAPAWWGVLGVSGRARASQAELALVLLLAGGLSALAFRRWRTRIRPIAATAGRLFFAPASLSVHLPLSLLLVVSHIALFMAAARALLLDAPFGLALHVVPMMLIASSWFAFFGGFGSREAAAAALYHLAGRSAAEGVAISFVFGAVSVLGSLPGVLALQRRAGAQAAAAAEPPERHQRDQEAGAGRAEAVDADGQEQEHG
jgi:uncharacterized membrane protein YbhN (UPF0104 family)